MSDIRLVYGLRTLFSDLFSNPAYQPYDLSIDQVLLAEETRVNRDPFDALICAAARDRTSVDHTRQRDPSAGVVRVIW